MKFIILSGLALAGLVGCSAPKTYTLDDKAKNGVIEAQQRKIGQLMEANKRLIAALLFGIAAQFYHLV